MKIRSLSILVFILALAATAFADSVTIFSTGVNGSGALLASGAVDPHYVLISGPFTPTAIVNYETGFWVPNSATSQWITPQATASQASSSTGTYDYQTTFSLVGLDLGTVVISGAFASDNLSTISLNGSPTGIIENVCQLSCFTPFTINSGFVSGLNTLDFLVTNDGVATGLRVDLSGTADPTSSTVPEPGTLWLLATGLLALCGAVIRRRRMNPITTGELQ